MLEYPSKKNIHLVPRPLYIHPCIYTIYTGHGQGVSVLILTSSPYFRYMHTVGKSRAVWQRHIIAWVDFLGVREISSKEHQHRGITHSFPYWSSSFFFSFSTWFVPKGPSNPLYFFFFSLSSSHLIPSSSSTHSDWLSPLSLSLPMLPCLHTKLSCVE